MHSTLSNAIVKAYGPETRQLSVQTTSPTRPHTPYLITLRASNAAEQPLRPHPDFLGHLARRLHLRSLEFSDGQVMFQLHASQAYAPALARQPDLHSAVISLAFEPHDPVTILEHTAQFAARPDQRELKLLFPAVQISSVHVQRARIIRAPRGENVRSTGQPH